MALKGLRPRRAAARAGWVFNPPPGWPAPPPGWQPPKGWQPDPAWPPAPAGWEFWKPELPAEPPGAGAVPQGGLAGLDLAPQSGSAAGGVPQAWPPEAGVAPQPGPPEAGFTPQSGAPEAGVASPGWAPGSGFASPGGSPGADVASPGEVAGAAVVPQGEAREDSFSPAARDIHLTFEDQSQVFPPEQLVRIGRASDNHIVVGHPAVSRKHAHLSWAQDGWVFENIGLAPTFLDGESVSRVAVSQPVELTLGSEHGPVLRLEPAPPPAPPAPPPTPAAEVAPSTPTVEVPPPTFAVQSPPPAFASEVPPSAFADQAPPPAQAAPPPAFAEQASPPAQAPPAAFAPHPQSGFVPQNPPPAFAPQTPRPAYTPQAPPPPLAGQAPPRRGGPKPAPGPPAAPSGDELVEAFRILIPVRSWLNNPGWRQGLRLLVITYALLPLVFIALFASSGNLATPGWAYGLYVAPLWAIGFWLLIRPGPVRAVEAQVAIGIIIWTVVWLNVVTININDHLGQPNHSFSFPAALGVGYNEEITKALPVLLAGLILLKFRNTKLDVRMWMFLGTIAGLTFGVSEAALYASREIVIINQAQVASQAVAAVLSFAERVFVDGFQHAVWAGISAFFIGMAVNYPRRRIPLIILGVSIPAFLHALNDWSVGAFRSYWVWIIVQAVSLLLFLGYTMSAAAIERQVRQTPMFRGESLIMEAYSESKDA